MNAPILSANNGDLETSNWPTLEDFKGGGAQRRLTKPQNLIKTFFFIIQTVTSAVFAKGNNGLTENVFWSPADVLYPG